MTALEFALKNGYIGVKELPPWNGRQCFEALYAEESLNEVPAIGIPQIILLKDDKCRMASQDEAFEYMDSGAIGGGD